MRPSGIWLRLVSALVPGDERADWLEEWRGELTAHEDSMRHAWGALSDAWYLRTEGWTMEALLRDMRTATKSLLRRPALTAVGGVTLAVAIGATTAIYSVVDGVLVDQLPVPDPDRLVSYNHDAPNLGVNVPLVPHSEAMYLHYAGRARTLDALALFQQQQVSLITDSDPLQIDILRVTVPYFDVMGVQPSLGRTLVEGEDEEGAERVVVLSHSLWEQVFGAEREVLGRLLEINGVQRRVVGVMPERFAFLDEQAWIPMSIDRTNPDEGSIGLIGVGRLAERQSIEAANTEMQALLGTYAESAEGLVDLIQQSGMRADVKPLKAMFVQDLRQPLLILLGTVGFVFLIACANVANLFLVHAEARQRESAVRTAMGASRLDVVRQYLSESVTLALVGGLAGLLLASVGVQALLRLAPAELPQALDLGIDGSVLAFTASISVVAGILFGLFPALGYGRAAISQVLREGGRSATTGRQRHRLRGGLVIAQVALALVLLVGSGLMLRSFSALQDVDLGFEPEGLLTFGYGLPMSRYDSGPEVIAFHRNLMERLVTMPGVVAAGAINGLPLTGTKQASPMEPVDQPVAPGLLGPIVEQRAATPGYFEAMSIAILEGRPLEWTDRVDEVPGVVVSEALARSFWPGQRAVGRMIRNQGDENPSWEVVGVAADVRFDGVQDEPLPMLYWPTMVSQGGAFANTIDVVVRTSGSDPLALLDGARQALRELDPSLPVINPRTVRSVVSDSLSATSFTVVLLGISAGIALLLGTVGLYGVISFIVGRRTQEIGVRMALGASARSVLREVVGQGMSLTAAGLVVGLLGAWGVSRVLASLLYGVSATDPVTFAGTTILLGAVALLGTWLPARRAASVDPVEALRSE